MKTLHQFRRLDKNQLSQKFADVENIGICCEKKEKELCFKSFDAALKFMNNREIFFSKSKIAKLRGKYQHKYYIFEDAKYIYELQPVYNSNYHNLHNIENNTSDYCIVSSSNAKILSKNLPLTANFSQRRVNLQNF